MKQKLKKIVILWALMVLAGSVFGEDVIRSKRVGSYDILLTHLSSGYFVVIIDNYSRCYFLMGSYKRSQAMFIFDNFATPSYVTENIDSNYWVYDGVMEHNGWPSYHLK